MNAHAHEALVAAKIDALLMGERETIVPPPPDGSDTAPYLPSAKKVRS